MFVWGCWLSDVHHRKRYAALRTFKVDGRVAARSDQVVAILFVLV